MLTLWDLLEPLTRRLQPPPARPTTPAARRPAMPFAPQPPGERPTEQSQSLKGLPATRSAVSPPKEAAPTDGIPLARAVRSRSDGKANSTERMQAKYDAVVRLMLETHRVRVRKWRKSMSGIAWYVTYQDGKVNRLIESPRPKGPMSIAIFLHEIGHHAIGFNVYKPRCLEEYHAWRWSLEQMEAHGLNITDAVRHRVAMSLWYAVQKAQRRGIRELPVELLPYTQRPTKPRVAGRRTPRNSRTRPSGNPA